LNELALANYIDHASRAFDLPLDPAYREGVLAHFAVMQRMADLVLGLPLPDDAESACAFVP
jgi:hypothetical protein